MRWEYKREDEAPVDSNTTRHNRTEPNHTVPYGTVQAVPSREVLPGDEFAEEGTLEVRECVARNMSEVMPD